MREGEKGITAINLLVVIAIAAIIALGASMTIGQMISSSEYNKDMTKAIREAQSVGYWISQDALMANSIDVGDNAGTAELEFITLYWKNWQSGDMRTTQYIWLNSSDSLKKLDRICITRNKYGTVISNTTTLVADGINTATFVLENEIWKLGVEARSGDRSATREYEITPRWES